MYFFFSMNLRSICVFRSADSSDSISLGFVLSEKQKTKGGKGWLEPPGKFSKLVSKTSIRRKMRFEILSKKDELPRDFGKNLTHGDSFYWSLQQLLYNLYYLPFIRVKG